MSELNLDPKSTAVVVIDLQKGIVAMPGAPHSCASVVANAIRLLSAGRAAGAQVVLVHVDFSEGWRDALQLPVDAPMRMSSPPPDWAELLPELNRQPGDVVILKRQWGAFYGTELDLQLRRRVIKTVVMCGIATEAGVESTAREAWEHNYAVVFAEDAMTGFNSHVNSVTNIFPRLGRVRSTDRIVEAFSAAEDGNC